MNLEFIEEQVKQIMLSDTSGHDWWHVHRVCTIAENIQQQEGGNYLIVKAAGLLHDVDDWKLSENSESLPNANRILTASGACDADREHILEIITHLSFKGAGVKCAMRTLEGKIVQDADRIDAIGAIGIARCFAFGGHKGRPIYDPNQAPVMHQNFEDYKKSQSASLNHFYEKLFLLKDLMNTETAKKIALNRHNFMQEFVTRFLEEWG